MSGREKPLILQNGMPIPQAYDKDLGDWTEYSTEHIKAIKAELALVKAELQAIKANQLSGDQKVALSGNIVAEKYVTIINALEVRSDSSFNLITHGAMTEQEVRKYKNFKISFESTLDVPAGILIYTATRARNATSGAIDSQIYYEGGILPANPGRLIIGAKAGGAGVGPRYKAVPALEGVHSNLIVFISFSGGNVPSVGSLTIGVEMHG